MGEKEGYKAKQGGGGKQRKTGGNGSNVWNCFKGTFISFVYVVLVKNRIICSHWWV